jgi:hypothetical protein
MAEIQSSFLHCTNAAIPAGFRSLNGHDGASDADASVANRDDEEQQGAADTADRGLSGMRVGNTSIPL